MPPIIRPAILEVSEAYVMLNWKKINRFLRKLKNSDARTHRELPLEKRIELASTERKQIRRSAIIAGYIIKEEGKYLITNKGDIAYQ